MRTTKEIRELYLKFFESKGHTVIPSASLIPENDPTVLFTTAGMHPLVPYLLGEAHPGGKRLASCQKCIRTIDIDEVGDATHLTFFEMLGNWSLGDYFKKDAIEMSWEFLTSEKWLNLNKKLIAVSVFKGDDDAPFDEEAFSIWRSLGVPEARIAKLPKKNNWWGPAGETGPCGPDTEMFYWTGNPDKVPDSFNDDNVLWVEIWNDVFMQYNKTKEGTYVPLKQKNVDTGMGLERTVMVLNGKKSVFEIDEFVKIISAILSSAGQIHEISETEGIPTFVYPRGPLGKNITEEESTKAVRVIADHLRAATFILGDEKGITPSNVGQGYVLRRLIRRTIRYGKLIGINMKFTTHVGRKIIETYQNQYPELKKNESKILDELEKEEEKFAVALEQGIKEFEKNTQKKDRPLLAPHGGGRLAPHVITGIEAFNLYQTYGFPKELIQELCKERDIVFDENGFDEEFKKHQELSRTASAGAFKGGLADHSDEVVKYHTATHLLHKALRETLGDHVEQKGSNLTAERLRFDFSHLQKMTPEELKKVEDRVNEIIKKDLPVHFEMLSVEEAKKRGAIGLFEEKYKGLGEKVKVYFIGNYSAEICGGPHVEHTGQIGSFKIAKEEAVAAGIRRIKAVRA